MKDQPIFITGAERSGSSLISRILTISGGCFTGNMSTMYENYLLKQLNQSFLLDSTISSFSIESPPGKWKEMVEALLHKQGYKENIKWMFKESSLTRLWKIWNHYYPDAKWIIVRRKPTEIINSCVKTNWMRLMKNPETLKLIGVTSEEEGWQWWIRRYEEQWVKMIEAGINCKVIWPDRMVEGDYSQIKEMLDWLGLNWTDKIIDTIDPLINRRK